MACQVRTGQTTFHGYTIISYFCPAATLRKFGAGTGPVLLSKVTCDQSHSKLSQCVHPKQIGLHNCDRNQAVGVVCHEISSYNMYLTSTHPPLLQQTKANTFAVPLTPPNKIQSAVLGVVGGGLIMVVISAVGIVLIIVMVKRRKTDKHGGKKAHKFPQRGLYTHRK